MIKNNGSVSVLDLYCPNDTKNQLGIVACLETIRNKAPHLPFCKICKILRSEPPVKPLFPWLWPSYLFRPTTFYTQYLGMVNIRNLFANVSFWLVVIFT